MHVYSRLCGHKHIYFELKYNYELLLNYLTHIGIANVTTPNQLPYIFNLDFFPISNNNQGFIA